jgi:hypothetical protein
VQCRGPHRILGFDIDARQQGKKNHGTIGTLVGESWAVGSVGGDG